MVDIVTTPPEQAHIKDMRQLADKSNKDERLRAACAEFESIFIYQLLKTMREAVPTSTLFHGGLSEDIYTSMFDQEVAKKVAEKKGIGLAERLYEDFSQSAKMRRKEIPGSVDQDNRALREVKHHGE